MKSTGFELVERLAALADRAGLSMLELGRGFVDTRPVITSTIIGPRTLPQLEGLLAAADVVLDDHVLAAIDDIVPPGREAPNIGHYRRDPALKSKTSGWVRAAG